MSLFSFWGGLTRRMRRVRVGGFAGLVIDGHDVRELIARERGIARLTFGFQAALHHGEMRWAEACARRLYERRPDWRHAVTMGWITARVNKLDEAGAFLDAVPPSRHNHPFFREARAGFEARKGNIDEAMALFETCPGAVPGVRPARSAIGMATEMLGHSDYAKAIALIERLRDLYPDNLRVRALDVHGRIIVGDENGARDLCRVGGEALSEAGRQDRRAMIDAQMAHFAHRGWVHEQFELCRKALKDDPGHWALYTSAADIAKVTGREREYLSMFDALPPELAKAPEAVAIACRMHLDRHELARAAECLAKLRVRSPSLYLNLRLYEALNQQSAVEAADAYHACVEAGIPNLGPAISYGLYLYFFQGSLANHLKARQVLDDSGVGDTINTALLQLDLRLLIGLGRVDEAARRFETIPEGLRKSAKLRPFAMYFDARAGNHDAARKGWAEYVRSTRHLCSNALSSYPETVRLRYEESPGAVLCFTVVFNGAVYLEWYLRHYRDLGVNHFFIIDNGSNDGTLEHLLEQPDVSVFRNTGSFAAAQFGIMWTNHLLQKYGVGHWCLCADIDEGFVFPGQDAGRTLEDLLAYCDRGGFEAVPALALDMYPERLDQSCEDPFATNCYFDFDYEAIANDIPPYTIIQGGIRQRMTGLAMMLHKVPLIKMATDVRFIDCNHNITHVPIADILTAVLHYKFVGDMISRLDEAIGRNEHFSGAIAYRRLRKSSEKHQAGEVLLSEFSRRFETTADLLAAGVIRSSPAWDTFRPAPGNMRSS